MQTELAVRIEAIAVCKWCMDQMEAMRKTCGCVLCLLERQMGVSEPCALLYRGIWLLNLAHDKNDVF